MSMMQAGEVNFRLTAIRKTVVGSHNRSGRWLFRCECGAEVEAIVYNVRNGHTKSCGCLNSETVARRNYIHGGAGSFEHKAWLRMRQRCTSDEPHKRKAYKDRGIAVCAEWQNDFEAFLKHVGFSPSSKHSLDRKVNDVGYQPGNVRWATKSEQMKNRRPFARRRNAGASS